VGVTEELYERGWLSQGRVITETLFDAFRKPVCWIIKQCAEWLSAHIYHLDGSQSVELLAGA